MEFGKIVESVGVLTPEARRTNQKCGATVNQMARTSIARWILFGLFCRQPTPIAAEALKIGKRHQRLNWKGQRDRVLRQADEFGRTH